MMKSWIRVVLPSELYIIGACTIYLVLSLSTFLIEMGQRANGMPAQASSAGLIVLSILALSYGSQRVKNFHPACQAEYRNWLRTTPWHSKLPLPLGPVHLLVQDLLIVGLMTGLSSLHKGFEWYFIPGAFFMGYFVSMLFPLILTRQYLPSYLILVGLGGVVYSHDSPLGLAVLWIVLYAIAWAGQRDSLRKFEQWDMDFFDERIAPFFKPQGVQEVARSHILGWPFDRIAPHRNQFAVHWKFAVPLAILIGWWWFVLIETTRIFEARFAPMFGIALLGFLSFSRVWTYCWGYVPPLSLPARILKFRWIIPGYDVVFLAPLLMIAWVIATIIVQQVWNVPGEIVGPVQVTVLILINCLCPPSLDAWRLTGNHRIIPATSQNVGELQETK